MCSKPYMQWIDFLAEVGEPIKSARAALVAKLTEADELEARAQALRAEVRTGHDALMARIMKTWTLAEVECAGNKADGVVDQ